MNLSDLNKKLRKGDIKTLCTRCGLSRSTVSGVLNGTVVGTDSAVTVVQEAVKLVNQRAERLKNALQRVDNTQLL